ncbi:(+)-larreatricin hydroxylase, chloroplastic [Dichanthelium oligosanthes]|uniref:(+)-larreatricin hydroxylase, chloroplastic n=1 Tax=Dichanthelium oligosanthes TaxID=888268 RepID=A0A1E5WJW0_9POAL|nr:(+)-larreatricin hydroxylase, chloroplastic [Dichanthelium oligosanthes]
MPAMAMATPSSKASCLLLPSPPPARPSMLLAKKRTQRHRTLSCRASVHFDRRDMLLAGLTGVAAGGLGAYPGHAATEDTSTEVCPRGEKVTDKLLACQENGQKPCPPTSPTVFDFTPPTGPMRLRQPAHLADAGNVEKYRKALAAMKALPDSDPRSFASQAAIHQAYCDGHYRYDPTKVDAPFDVHFSWIFAPWHRMYIYFYERILGSLIGDDAFALPYWNWDAPAGMSLPDIFKDTGSPLYDAKRNPAHLDAYVNLDILNADDTIIPFDPQAVQYNQVVQNNLCTLYVQMMRNSKAQHFLGDKFCARYPGTVSSGTSGSLESMAHTSVHVWAGDPASSELGHDGQQHTGADMGFLATAGRDPVFYSHHANVDRMWHLWATKLGRTNFDDPEWLDTSFVFYDEKPQLVRIKVRDVLDASKLKYGYDEREPLQWMGARPTPLLLRKGGAAATTTTRKLRGAAPAPTFPLTLKEGQSVVVPSVPMPKAAAAGGGGKKQPDTVLVFDGIEFEPSKGAKFDVVINVPPEHAASAGPRHSEYAGSFATLPRGGNKPGETVVVALVLPLDEVLADIGVGDEEGTVNVVIVPRTQGIKIISPPRIETRER